MPQAQRGTSIAVPVLHDHLVGIMAVAVEHHVDAGCMGYHICIGPWFALGFIAEMAHQHHIFRAFGAGASTALLNGLVDSLSGLILQEPVDEVAFFVLEISRSGGCQSHRGRDADESDLDAVDFLDQVTGRRSARLP